MRLGVISRSLLVASGFWMVGGTFYFAQAKYAEAEKVADEFYVPCEDAQSVSGEGPTAGPSCWELRNNIVRARTVGLSGGLYGFAAFQAATVLAIALAMLATCYIALRWILAGRMNRTGNA